MTFVKFNTLEVSFKGHVLPIWQTRIFFFDRSAQIRAATEKHIAIYFFLKLKLKLCWTFSHIWKGTKAVQGGRTSVMLQVSSPLVTSESAGFLNRATLLQFIAECDTRQPCERRHRRRGIICASFHSVIRAAAGACLTSSRLQLPGVL